MKKEPQLYKTADTLLRYIWIMRRQFRKFLNSNPIGLLLKPVFDSKLAKVAISYAFIVTAGIITFVYAKNSVDRNRAEIMRRKKRILEAEQKYAEEYWREKDSRGSE